MAKSYITVDSSVFISNFVTSDSHHEISKRFFWNIKKKKLVIVIPLTTLLEILQAYFRLSGDRDKTDRIYEEMIEWNISRKLRLVNLEASFLIYFTAYHHLFPLKTADAIVALTAHRFKQPLITWDKQLLEKTKKHITTYTPGKFLTA